MIVAAVGGDPELALGPGPDVVLAHQSGDPLAANPVALGLQAGVHARAAIGLSAAAVNRLDLLDQGLVLGGPPALRPPQPVVEAAGRGIQHPAHQAHRKVFAMISDELKLHFGTSEKMATTFLKYHVPSASARSRASASGSLLAKQRQMPQLPQSSLILWRGLGVLPIYVANAVAATRGCPDPWRPGAPSDPRPRPAAPPPP